MRGGHIDLVQHYIEERDLYEKTRVSNDALHCNVCWFNVSEIRKSFLCDDDVVNTTIKAC